MKQQLLLSALVLIGAGVIGGCCNSCGSDCGEAVEVETIEIVPCPSGKDCPGKPHYHLHHKGANKPASPGAAGSCGSNSCPGSGKTALVGCGADHTGNSGGGHGENGNSGSSGEHK